MKKLISLLLLFSQAHASSISFVGPCSKKPLFETALSDIEGYSVGKVTIETLQAFSISFKGTEQGMNSIFDTPTGLDAMEVISNTEMMAHGWCYSVNGFEPNTYPHEYLLEEDDEVLWWFGYAHNKDGKWITQCEPTYKRKPDQFCKKAARIDTNADHN